MDSVERIMLTVDHKEPDRVAIHDTFWPSTIDRWHGEGLPQEVPSIDAFAVRSYERKRRSSDVSQADYFGLEIVNLRPDITPRFPTEVVEETEDTLLERTPYGTLRRQVKSRASVPHVEEWSINNRDDWNRIKPRLQPDPSRVNWQAAQAVYDRARQQGKFIIYQAHIGWAQFQEYIRNDQLLMILALEPEWAREMFQVHAELVIGMAQIMMDRGLDFDGARFDCDLGYRNSTFISPQMYRDLQFPSDRQVFHFFRDKGKAVILHSDGRVKSLIPQFLEAGISCLNPIETKAGMDLIELKHQYGRDLAFMGGIDARAMADPDPRVIEEEIKRKFEAAMPGGGYIYHSDHSVPDNVSFHQYQHVLDLVRQYGVYH